MRTNWHLLSRLAAGRSTARSQLQNQRRLLATKSSSAAEPQVDSDQHEISNHIDDQLPVTNRLQFIGGPKGTDQPQVAAISHSSPMPIYRVLGQDGRLVGEMDPELSPDLVVRMYEKMLLLNTMDRVMFDSQRQGRISFYMTSFGEEALQLGSAGALQPHDWVFAQYREAGLLLWRQMSLKLMLAQCFGNAHDLGKGRQMPIHYGSRALNYVTVSSPLGTQMPQAAGAAYRLKLEDQAKGEATSSDERRVAACYFGEGAASEGDAHAAMNFAATLKCPVVFVCRNNRFAISTPSEEQYAGDGIVARGPGYGIPSIRVDGNDLFAVYAATRAARSLSAGQWGGPTLIEAMSYRLGHHSTSDDSSAYRSAAEVQRRELEDNPMRRTRSYLLSESLWSESREEEARTEARRQVIEALSWAERQKKLPISSMFDDVYHELPAHLIRQRQELKDHLAKFGQHYGQLGDFEEWK